MYYNRTERPPARAEEFIAPEIVEKHGYIPLKKRVEDMMLAGKRLMDYRAGMYDQSEKEAYENPDFRPDVTREKGFDFADASAIKNMVEEKLGQYRAEKEASEAKKKASEGLEKQPDTSDKESGMS